MPLLRPLALLLSAGVSAPAIAAQTIVDQTAGSTGHTTSSQNFGANMLTQGADSFVLKQTATLTTMIANGAYFDGSGPASSENVAFYADARGKPGKPIARCSYFGLAGKDNAGRFTVTLQPACKLAPARYWVSLVANISFGGGATTWGWLDATETGPHAAAWQNPHGATCPTWQPVKTCFPGHYRRGYDYQLLGRTP